MVITPGTDKNRPHTSKKIKSYEATMAEITKLMPVHERLFSKFIHAKVIATLSDVIGSTVARPNAILSGAVFSFMLTLILYWFAKNLGYVLSGFESIVAFALGWLLGLTYDMVKLMITGKR